MPIYLFVYVYWHTCQSPCVEVRGQRVWVSALLIPTVWAVGIECRSLSLAASTLSSRVVPIAVMVNAVRKWAEETGQ